MNVNQVYCGRKLTSQSQVERLAAMPHNVKATLAPFTSSAREPREHDVLIDIKYCGICHSDIHQARDEWGDAIFPMVPGPRNHRAS